MNKKLSPEDYDAIHHAFLFPEKYIRRGQSLMNSLYKINKRLYCEVIEAELDCFHHDAVAEKTLSFLKGKVTE